MTLRLEDIELIKRLKYTYARSLDTGNITRAAACFTEDAEIDYRGGSYRFTLKGRIPIEEALRAAFHPGLVGSHTMHMPVIDVHDDDTADGEWTLIDYALNLAEDNKATVGAAHYFDHYVKTDGNWLIARTEYDRIYERVYRETEPGVTAHMLATVLADR
jgi:hypothetical protein